MNFFSIVALFVIIWYNIIEVSGIYMNLFDYALKYGDMSFSEMPFNEVEKTWDCPCHASRFDIDGKCISGPSNRDIGVNKELDE